MGIPILHTSTYASTKDKQCGSYLDYSAYLFTHQVMPLLSHPNEKIVYEVLAFLEAILEYGNTYVQEGLKDLIESREHQVFPTLREILQKASVIYKERYNTYVIIMVFNHSTSTDLFLFFLVNF